MKNDNLSIDKNLLETLCSYQASIDEITSLLSITEKELNKFVLLEYDLKWPDFYKSRSAKGKAKIRENQIKLSAKSAEMAKHLGKIYLEQEKPVQSIVSTRNIERVMGEVLKQLHSDEEFLSLNLKHQSFVKLYIITKNGTQSAIQAGYAEKSARSQASQILTILNIKILIEKYTKIEAELAADEKEELIDNLIEIRKQAMSAMLYTPGMGGTAVAAIKQHSAMRGFDAPTEFNAKLSLKDILKAQEGEGVIDLN